MDFSIIISTDRNKIAKNPHIYTVFSSIGNKEKLILMHDDDKQL